VALAQIGDQGFALGHESRLVDWVINVRDRWAGPCPGGVSHARAPVVVRSRRSPGIANR
jgi:hypothetical protein